MTPRIAMRRAAGFSLIELLVALALSIFLIAGVVVMYLSTSESYHVQQQTAQIQERERLAATFIGSVVQSAGYLGAPATYDPESAFPADATFATNGQALYGTSGSYAAGAADMIDVRILAGPGDPVLNCLGYGNNSTDSVQLYVNEFYLNTAKQTLNCTLSGPGLTTQTQPLLDGVMGLQILYGVDTNGDGSADEYLDAGAGFNWTAVRSVRVTLKLAANKPTTGIPNAGTAPVTFSAVFPIRPTVQ